MSDEHTHDWLNERELEYDPLGDQGLSEHEDGSDVPGSPIPPCDEDTEDFADFVANDSGEEHPF